VYFCNQSLKSASRNCGTKVAVTSVGQLEIEGKPQPKRTPMTYRKLRIAWSVACGLAAVLVCVVWVRSYQSLDNLIGQLPLNPVISWTSA